MDENCYIINPIVYTVNIQYMQKYSCILWEKSNVIYKRVRKHKRMLLLFRWHSNNI